MTVENLVILLEEPSAKKMLDVVVPKILPPGISHRCIPFQGKSDLEKKHFLKNSSVAKAEFRIPCNAGSG